MELSKLEINSAFYQAMNTWGSLPVVTGIDIGYRSFYTQNQCLALRIHIAYIRDMLSLRAMQPVPRSLEGIPTCIVQGNYQALATEESIPPSSPQTIQYPVNSAGLGAALYSGVNVPCSGSRTIAANSHINNVHASDILSLGNTRDSQHIYRLIEAIESEFKRKPNACTEQIFHTLLSSNPARSNNTSSIDIVAPTSHPTTTSNQNIVDGFGLYAVGTGSQRRFVEGFRVLPL